MHWVSKTLELSNSNMPWYDVMYIRPPARRTSYAGEWLSFLLSAQMMLITVIPETRWTALADWHYSSTSASPSITCLASPDK